MTYLGAGHAIYRRVNVYTALPIVVSCIGPKERATYTGLSNRVDILRPWDPYEVSHSRQTWARPFQYECLTYGLNKRYLLVRLNNGKVIPNGGGKLVSAAFVGKWTA